MSGSVIGCHSERSEESVLRQVRILKENKAAGSVLQNGSFGLRPQDDTHTPGYNLKAGWNDVRKCFWGVILSEAKNLF